MAFSHGSIAKIFVAGFDASPFYNEVTLSGTIDTAETTALGDTAKKYIYGTEDATAKCSGFLDHNSIDANSYDYKLTALKRAIFPVTFLPQADLAGSPAYIGLAELTSHDIGATVKDAASCDTEFQFNDGFPRGKSAAAIQTVTASGNSVYLDDSVGTTDGVAATLHVLAVSGTATPTLTVKLQTSSDHTTWVDAITFDAATGVTSQYKTASGTVGQYVRLLWTVTGTTPSFTFHVAYSRNP